MSCFCNYGLFIGSESSVKAELADVRQYCSEGTMVAEACGDAEIQAEFMLQAVILNIMDGRPVADTKLLLQVSWKCHM